jgi:tetratricopeptide (TPR) repeat protein
LAPLRQHPADPLQVKVALLQAGALILLILLPAILTLGISFVKQRVTDLELIMDRASQKWVIVTLVSYGVMSIIFVWLASPKGDLQDYFIQRVKFISSHALYSIWVGYGMIVGFAYALILTDKFFRSRRPINLFVSGAGTAFVLLLPLVPLGQNAFNKEQIRRVGGAEQNGHDFGWQFGNYQLRGAEAISEELDPEEEPLPNPSFPPEMGQDAIFFGGTDPGRFVPTYMIYSARVREDVYLITQNALADNTYMGVMRDLYGDRIWIPSQPESALAFQRYVQEVESGKRPRNADLKIEGGRVQVRGALGVMEINGILCQMIFERNNYKNPFYIEESYVIRWMYPYLTPHGLIMKINVQPTDLSDDIVRNDMDFWDWYTRRLSSNNKFIRDIVARKSFSKLRTAIGGLYAARGRFREAEEAYQEGRILYSLSPEANFRLAQEVYLSHGRSADAKAVIRQFSSEDPGNKQALAFLAQIDGFDKMNARVGELEQLMPQGKLSVDAALELGDLYLQSGQAPKFMALAGSIVANTNLPSIYTFRIAALYHRAGRFGEMSQALDQFLARLPPDIPPEAFVDMTRMYLAGHKTDKARNVLQEYLKRRPGDWRAWMDQASLELGLGRTNEAIRALEVAVRGGGNEAIDFINRNPNYTPIREEAVRRAQTLINLPGVKPLTPW